MISEITELITNLAPMHVNLLHGHLFPDLPIYEGKLGSKTTNTDKYTSFIHSVINNNPLYANVNINLITNRAYSMQKISIVDMAITNDELLKFKNAKILSIERCKSIVEVSNKGLTYLNCNDCMSLSNIKYPEELTHLYAIDTQIDNDVISKCHNLRVLHSAFSRNITDISNLIHLREYHGCRKNFPVRKLDKLITIAGTGNLDYVRDLDVFIMKETNDNIFENLEVLHMKDERLSTEYIAKCKKIKRLHLMSYGDYPNVTIDGLQYLEEVYADCEFNITIKNCPQLIGVYQ